MNKEIKIKDGEKIEDLQFEGLAIIQSSSEYRFTSDAVLLANFVKVKKGSIIADLGTGSGIIALLIAAKQLPEKIFAVEIQPQLADMAKRSVSLNKLNDKIEVICMPMQEFSKTMHSFDVVVCNPPYRKIGSGEKQAKKNISICRHEIAVTLEEMISSAAALLKDKGDFYLIHQSERLAEIFVQLAKHQLQPKILVPIYAREGDVPYGVLIKATKGANHGLLWEKGIIMFDKNGNFTKTIERIYNGKK